MHGEGQNSQTEESEMRDWVVVRYGGWLPVFSSEMWSCDIDFSWVGPYKFSGI